MQRRRRWTASEKAGGVNGTPQPGVSVSEVARRHGAAPESAFSMGPTTAQGAFSGVDAGEGVVPASEYRMLQQQNRELQRLLGEKTMENEGLHQALEWRTKKVCLARTILAANLRRKASTVACALRVSRSALMARQKNGRRGRPRLVADVRRWVKLSTSLRSKARTATGAHGRFFAQNGAIAAYPYQPQAGVSRDEVARAAVAALDRQHVGPPLRWQDRRRSKRSTLVFRWPDDCVRYSAKKSKSLLHWIVAMAKRSTGLPRRGAIASEHIRDLMLASIERRFSGERPEVPIQWLWAPCTRQKIRENSPKSLVYNHVAHRFAAPNPTAWRKRS